MAEEIGFENGRNSNFEGLVTLTLTLDLVIRHTVVHHSSTSTYIPNFIEIEETFCGRTDVRTDVRKDIFPPLILLGRLLEVDLKTLLHAEITAMLFTQLPSSYKVTVAKQYNLLSAKGGELWKPDRQYRGGGTTGSVAGFTTIRLYHGMLSLTSCCPG